MIIHLFITIYYIYDLILYIWLYIIYEYKYIIIYIHYECIYIYIMNIYIYNYLFSIYHRSINIRWCNVSRVFGVLPCLSEAPRHISKELSNQCGLPTVEGDDHHLPRSSPVGEGWWRKQLITMVNQPKITISGLIPIKIKVK